ncbi:hypothetical protein RhiirA4_481277, partial [Rhizophagus irregularis]
SWPARKTNERLNKLYTKFNAGPQCGHSNSKQSRTPFNSRSRSRSNSRSRYNNNSSSKHSNDINHSGSGSSSARTPVCSLRNQSTTPQSTAQDTTIRNLSHPESTFPSTSQATLSLPPDIIKEIRDQLKSIADQLRGLDERIENLEYTVTDYTYRISELESAMNFDEPPYDNEEPAYQPNSYTQQGCEWNNKPYDGKQDNSFSPGHNDSNPSLMDSSPDASFSALNPSYILSRRHAPLPVQMDIGYSPNDSALHHEVLSISNTHKNLSQQLGSIMEKLDSFSSPTRNNNNNNNYYYYNNSLPFLFPEQLFNISPDQYNRELNFSNILHIGTLNVRSLVHASKQLNLFSLLLSHQLHGFILTETNLQSPAHKYICEPYLSQFNYHKWFSFLTSANHHAGVGILLHSSLAMYVIKKRFHKDRLISLLLQLPGRKNLLIIGAYIPPSRGDLNANFDSFINNILHDNVSSPLHPLFRYLHTHQFDDLDALDPSTSSPLPTFKSTSSGQLSRLDYLWTSPGLFISCSFVVPCDRHYSVITENTIK